MAQITLIHGDAADNGRLADMIFTDPPYEMPGAELARILAHYDAPHLALITTMRQLLDYLPHTDWRLNFDFVLDGVAPKKSKSLLQPNYTHQTGVYLTRPGVKSAFNRKRRQRSDVFEANGYWPTIFHAPRKNMQEHGHRKNATAITDLLGSFDVQSVVDPFAGLGTTALAAFELGIKATAIERDKDVFEQLHSVLQFIGVNRIEIIK